MIKTISFSNFTNISEIIKVISNNSNKKMTFVFKGCNAYEYDPTRDSILISNGRIYAQIEGKEMQLKKDNLEVISVS